MLKSLRNESYIFEQYRKIPSRKIRYCGRYLACSRIERITHSFLFKKSWKDNSGKTNNPPDFINDKHKMMIDFMRIDDSIRSTKRHKVENSFQKEKKLIDKCIGKYYKEGNGILITNVDTSDNSVFNYSGYLDSFKRTLIGHSDKIDQYRENHPNCKTCILFICDETNTYAGALNRKDKNIAEADNSKIPIYIIHHHFSDKRFLDVIKQSKADFVIWYKENSDYTAGDKRFKRPKVCIFDVKHINEEGIKYNESLIFKVVDKPKKIAFKKAAE